MTRALAPLALVLAAAAPLQRTPVDLEPGKASLLVRVFDASGLPWSEGKCFRPLDVGPPVEATWPTTVRVLVFERDDLGGAGTAAGDPVLEPWRDVVSLDRSTLLAADVFSARRSSLGAGEAEFDVVPGGHYLVGAMGPGLDGRLREVDVPDAGGRLVVDLRARDRGEPGWISVRVLRGGRELTGAEASALSVDLGTVDGDARLLNRDGALCGPPPYLFHVPAGSYRITAEGRAQTNWHGVVWRQRELGRSAREIEVSSGERVEIELDIDGGAKLEVSIDGAVTEADRQAVRNARFAPYPLGPKGDREAAFEQLAAQAELSLVTEERRRDPVLFLEEGFENTSAAGLHLWERWPLGTTRVSECLPTGRHTLVARLPGGREARAEVELFEGRTTPVRLRF